MECSGRSPMPPMPSLGTGTGSGDPPANALSGGIPARAARGLWVPRSSLEADVSLALALELPSCVHPSGQGFRARPPATAVGLSVKTSVKRLYGSAVSPCLNGREQCFVK